MSVDLVRRAIASNQSVMAALLADDTRIRAIAEAGALCVETLAAGGKILLAGNGGSAADAQHIAAELVSRFNYDRPGLPAFALTTDTSALLAIGNDYGFDRVFSRQMEAVGNAGDLFFGITTSGNSPNILAAAEAAKAKNIRVVGLTGEGGGKLAGICNTLLTVPSAMTPRIQECHILIGHVLCQIIEDHFYGASHGAHKVGQV